MQTDQYSAKASTATVSPPTINDITKATGGLQINKEDATAPGNWTKAEDKETLAKHGISSNHLFGKVVDAPQVGQLLETINLSKNSL